MSKAPTKLQKSLHSDENKSHGRCKIVQAYYAHLRTAHESAHTAHHPLGRSLPQTISESGDISMLMVEDWVLSELVQDTEVRFLFHAGGDNQKWWRACSWGGKTDMHAANHLQLAYKFTKVMDSGKKVWVLREKYQCSLPSK